MDDIVGERSRALSDGCSQLHLKLFLNVGLYSSVHAHYHKRLCPCIQSRKELDQPAEWSRRVGGGEYLPFSLFFSLLFSFPPHLVFLDTLCQLVQTEEPDSLDSGKTHVNMFCSLCRMIRPLWMSVTCPKQSRSCKEWSMLLIWYNHWWDKKGNLSILQAGEVTDAIKATPLEMIDPIVKSNPLTSWSAAVAPYHTA